MKMICKLCGINDELQNSHIIPSFIYRWLKETSGTGFLRFGQTPNKRVQDGLKDYLLCSSCEGLFQKLYTKSADRDRFSIKKMERFLVKKRAESWQISTTYVTTGCNQKTFLR